MSVVRRLLNVWQSTPKLTCLLEAGIPSLEAIVKNKQSKFLRRMFEERDQLTTSDPLMFTLDFMKTNFPSHYELIEGIMSRDDYLSADRSELVTKIRESTPTAQNITCTYR